MEHIDATTESRKRKREEYEMQLFGFHTRAVYATFKNIVMGRIQSKSRKLAEALEKIYKTDSASLDAIKLNEEQLVRTYHAACLPHLRAIENIVNRFVCVPNDVLADEDRLQSTQYTEAEFESIRGKLSELQQRAKRATMLNAALKEELQFIEQLTPCTSNTEELSQIIESAAACPLVSDKIHRLVDDYRQLAAALDDGPVLQKTLYNTVDNLECTDCDLND